VRHGLDRLKSMSPALHFTLCQNDIGTYVYTYHSCFIPEKEAETSQIFLRDTQVLSKFFSYDKYRIGVSAVNPLVAFYDIH
jgi:hypothetical protein